MAQAAIVARSSSEAPAAAAPRRMRSISSRISAGSFLVQSAIARAHDRVIAPAVTAAPSSGRSPSRRISRTAARASFLVSWPFAASQADAEPYPSAACAPVASNRRRNEAYAAASFPWISPRASSISPHPGPSSPAAAGELRKSANAPPARSASATLAKPALPAPMEPSAVHIPATSPGARSLD
jgi:hypothetical protein